MPLVIDLVMLVLLAGTVAYAALVERRVRALMQILRQLEPVVGEFSAAVDKSETSVGMLRSLAQGLPGFGRGAAEPEATEGEVSFKARAAKPGKPAGVRSIPGKSDLVRGFFEAARSRST